MLLFLWHTDKAGRATLREYLSILLEVWCIVSLSIFTSCIVFLLDHKASRNKTMSPNRPISYLLSKCFISCAFLKKRGESNSDSEASKRSRPVKQVLLQYKITNCLISQDICTLFGRCLYSNSCSWTIKMRQCNNPHVCTLGRFFSMSTLH